MALRLIEVFLKKDKSDRIRQLMKDKAEMGFWQEEQLDEGVVTKILVRPEKTEELLDLIESSFSAYEEFRAVLLPVEATLPRPEEPEKTVQQPVEPEAQPEKPKKERISREELYEDVGETIKLSWVFILLVILSSVVAAIGIMRNNVAVIIGAMVIAPLLGPNVALSLSATLGDIKLAWQALKTNVSGTAVAFLIALVLGTLSGVNPEIPEVVSRTKVGMEDIALALAAGSAATLSFTTGLSSALIGVMVAVSLLPPLVTCGILLGSGFVRQAAGALLLFLINVVCINLSGVVTFLVQGIRPRTWWEADKAKRATRTAIVLLSVLLFMLAVLILLLKTKL